MSRFPTVRKAVFPVAGLGTRFLPATKVVPKELLPIVDKPLIQYAVEEAVEAGIDTLILVTRGDKQAIREHFRRSQELERLLADRNQAALLQSVRDILPAGVRVEEAIQELPLGLGHAVLCARELVGNQPFAVILPDDVVRNEGQSCLAQMMAVYRATGGSVVGVERIAPELSRRYGVAAVRESTGGLLQITELVEKPEPQDAPSDLGVVGRYILSARVFGHLSGLGAGTGGEIQLTDGIASLMRESAVYAFPFRGRRYDCGSRLGLVQATVDFALADAELGPAMAAFLERKLGGPGRT